MRATTKIATKKLLRETKEKSPLQVRLWIYRRTNQMTLKYWIAVLDASNNTFQVCLRKSSQRTVGKVSQVLSKWTGTMANNKPIIHHLFRRQYGVNPTSNFQLTLFKDRFSIAKNLYKRDLISHYGCVNAIEFSQEGSYLTSGKLIFI